MVLTSIGNAVISSVCHGDVLPLVLGLRGILIHHTLWGVVSFHKNNLVACLIIGVISAMRSSLLNPVVWGIKLKRFEGLTHQTH